MRLVRTTGPQQAAVAAATNAPFVNQVGTTSVQDFARMVISNEISAVHLAALVDEDMPRAPG
jgi:Flp pilus assembly protein protease CpaA